MNHITLNAYAKINLALDVLAQRPDGYHEMKMIMQTLRLHDVLFIKKTDKPAITIRSNHKWLPLDKRNLAHKAATFMQEQYHLDAGVYIDLTKNIPVSAGLGGGSADCAATLLGLRALFDLPVSDEKLLSIGATLGADVPFCLFSKTALVGGIGERLTPLPDHPDTIVVVAKPSVRVSTANIFRLFDHNKVLARPDIDKMIADITNQRVDETAEGFCNVLETVTETLHPVITTVKTQMLAARAMGALMSGSGPSVFGYFTRKSDAFEAMKLIRRTVPACRDVLLTSTFCPDSRFMER